MNSYFCVHIDIPADLEDLVTACCFEHGAMGVSEELKFHQKAENYEPELIPVDRRVLKVYLEQAPTGEFKNEIYSLGEGIEFSYSEEENKDWLAEWKKGLKPFCLVDDFWVVPSWLEAPEENLKVISIDPGMAFGTGTHHTTMLASEALSSRSLKNASVLDVGTGTAILGILASLRGAKSVVATEIDAIARDVARENIKKNNCDNIQVLEEQIDEIKNQEFDFVIANIIDGVLIQIQSDLKRLTKVGGEMLLTGILKERREAFLAEFSFNPQFEVIETYDKGDWLGYLLKRLS